MKGHQRHIVVNILSNLLHVEVHAANLSDTVSGWQVLRRTAEKPPSLEAFSGDAGYSGTAVRFADEVLGLTFHLQPRSSQFAVARALFLLLILFICWPGSP